MFIAGIFLKEKIGMGKIIGVILFLSGVICIAI
jgi:drug/metabolite transporter (DMT)-like permease